MLVSSDATVAGQAEAMEEYANDATTSWMSNVLFGKEICW